VRKTESEDKPGSNIAVNKSWKNGKT